LGVCSGNPDRNRAKSQQGEDTDECEDSLELDDISLDEDDDLDLDDEFDDDAIDAEFEEI